MEDLRVGDEVLVSGKYRAVVRYIGTTSFKAGEWIGVELEKPKGKHDGTVRTGACRACRSCRLARAALSAAAAGRRRLLRR